MKTTKSTKAVSKSKPKPKRRVKTCGKSVESSQKPVSNLSKPASNLSLNAKQQLFVTEYLVDLNATQAAIRAGYSVRTARKIATENLSKPVIKVAIDAAIEARKARITFTADQVLEELALVGFSDMADFVEIDEGGAVRAYPLDSLAKGKSRIIRKVKEKRVIKSTAEGDQVLDSTYEFELCDKVKSLELLARHLGLLHDKTEVDLKQPVNVIIRQFREDPV
ncbi:MAG: terminase small subunit [Syntrophales bacterium]